MKPLGILVVVASLAVPGARAADAAKFFNDNCAACHTIGGGDGAGPDLIHAASMPRDSVRQAVVRMQDNVGPLQPDVIDALVDFVKSKARVVPASRRPAGSPQIGRELFYGDRAFANRGTPCFACHAVAGRGGNLAIDLTAVYTRRGEDAVVSTAQQPAIPLMKAAYAAHPITEKEACDLAAFFKEGGGKPPHSMDAGIVHGTATGVAVVVLAAIAIVVRPRRRRNP